MVLKNNNNNDAFQANYNFLQLSDSIKEIAVMISKTDIHLENIKTQQSESMKKIERIEEFINNFSNLENKIKIIEQKDLVIINKEIEYLKTEFKKVKDYIDELFKKIDSHKTKIWEVKGDTREIKVFNEDFKSRLKFMADLFFKIAIGLFLSFAAYKMGWEK
jgi:predicted RNase H-like nuclease (RuvC/YqgF family)